MAKVDIIVLSFNHWDVTQEFLSRLFSNTFVDIFRLVMIDNGSTDETQVELKKFLSDKKDVIMHMNNYNSGIISGRNTGWEIISADPSEFVMFLDNDQMVINGWLEHHLGFLERHNADIVGVEAWRMNDMFFPVERVQLSSRPFSYVGCGGMLIKSDVIKKIGLFDSIFNPCYFEDPDFIFRAYDAGYKICWNKSAKIVHMPHQTLGNMPKTEQRERFLNSYNKFKNKWRNRKLPVFVQED